MPQSLNPAKYDPALLLTAREATLLLDRGEREVLLAIGPKKQIERTRFLFYGAAKAYRKAGREKDAASIDNLQLSIRGSAEDAALYASRGFVGITLLLGEQRLAREAAESQARIESQVQAAAPTEDPDDLQKRLEAIYKIQLEGYPSDKK